MTKVHSHTTLTNDAILNDHHELIANGATRENRSRHTLAVRESRLDKGSGSDGIGTGWVLLKLDKDSGCAGHRIILGLYSGDGPDPVFVPLDNPLGLGIIRVEPRKTATSVRDG
jgi:hypothetical protein